MTVPTEHAQTSIDAAGNHRAACSGRRRNGVCHTCNHSVDDHDDHFICLICHQVCRYCGEFRDQHTVNEWLSCLSDLEHADQEADAMTWWRSQQ